MNAHVFVDRQLSLLPDVLKDGNDAGNNHAAQQHDEHTAKVGQAQLGAVRLARLLKKKGAHCTEIESLYFTDLD